MALSWSISFCIYCTANSILQSAILLKNLQDVHWLRLQNLSYRLPSVSALSSSAEVGLCGLKFFIVLFCVLQDVVWVSDRKSLRLIE